MLHRLQLIALLVLLLGATSGWDSKAIASDEDIAAADACNYYRLRAGPEPTRRPVTFAAFLAEICTAARQSLDSGLAEQRAAAHRLLTRIAELRQTIAEMNADRDKAVEGLTGVARMLALTRVTPSGEFLIAHHMGLLKDFDAWLDTGAEFSLASYR